MGVFSTCMHVYHLHLWCPRRQEEGTESPRTVATDGVSHHVDAGNQAQDLCKIIRYSKPLELHNFKLTISDPKVD